MRSYVASAVLIAWASATFLSALAAVSDNAEASSATSGSPTSPPLPQESRKRLRKLPQPPPPPVEANPRAHHADSGSSSKERKPNIILILTDDQDVELGSLNFMPRTVRLLKEEGAEFRHAYVTTPMCCPSRSSLLTGLYVHNHQTFTNNDNCSSSTWQANYEPRSFATYLSNAGYRTGYFGKYLNKYNGSYIPPGWREWGGLVMNSRYYNYSVNMNGRRVRHGDDYHKDYYPDVIVNDSISFLRQSKQSFSRKPVLLVLSFPAPHGPEDSAPQFADMFFNVTTHHTPTYDYAPNFDKQWILQVTGKMKPIHRQFTDLLMTKRLQTLQSVDLAVQRVYEELKSLGELDNTYIVYTSDHGYHLGQFGLIKGKSFPFEFDVRVPFLLRGPDVDPGTIIDEIVLNIDLAPTFLDMAGVEPPPHMDGRSFLRLLQRRRKRLRWPDTFLIESSGRRETGETPSPTPSSNTSVGTTTEAPDVQLDNRVAPSQASTPATGKHHRLATECQRTELRAPCRANQKWHCVLENGRWRKHKCKLPSSFTKQRSFDGKNCACFTPKGIVYTRRDPDPRRGIRTKTTDDVFDGEVTDTRRWRRKVDPKVAADLERRLQTTKRQRRASGSDDAVHDRVDDAIEEVHKEINMWQTTRPSPDSSEQSPPIPTLPSSQSTSPLSISPSVPSNAANCSRSVNGSVSCDRNVYADTKTWRMNREKIDKQIRFLRAQLVTLKEIRRHLREKRPHRKGVGTHPINPLFDSSEEEAEEDDDDDDEDADEDEPEPENGSPGVEPERVGPHRPLVDKSDRGGKIPLPTNDSNAESSSRNSGQIKEHTCYCGPDIGSRRSDKEAARAFRWRIKSDRLRRKQRKLRRRARLEKTCLSERMNCFSHDNEHWRTPPLWTAGPFCFCMNANNNTYSCLRTINSTHNFLYCEFVTGLVTYYNLRLDPFEQWNRAHMLSPSERSFMGNQLAQLKACRGSRQCTVGSGAMAPTPANPGHIPILPAHMNRRTRMKKRRYYPVVRSGHSNDRVLGNEHAAGALDHVSYREHEHKFHHQTIPSPSSGKPHHRRSQHQHHQPSTSSPSTPSDQSSTPSTVVLSSLTSHLNRQRRHHHTDHHRQG